MSTPAPPSCLHSPSPSVVGSVVREVAGRESVVVICGAGELFVCGTSKTGITLTSSLNLGSKVSQNRPPLQSERTTFSSDPSAVSVCVW